MKNAREAEKINKIKFVKPLIYAASFTDLVERILCISKLGVGPAKLAKNPLKSVIPMKRFGKAEEIADAVVWLASDNTKFITGQTLTLDGGTSL